MIKLQPSRRFAREALKLSPELRRILQRKLDLFCEDPSHPSLRVKKVKGRKGVWELSITEQYRVTFEWTRKGGIRIAILRRAGTHEILKRP